MEYLLQEIRPTSKATFAKYMKDYVHFELPDKYQPSATYFKPMYDALLLFRADFERTYKALSRNNEENIPEVSEKNGGLIEIFLTKIGNYAKQVFTEFHKRGKKYKYIDKFLDEFYNEVEKDYKLSLQLKGMNVHFAQADKSYEKTGVQLSKPYAYSKSRSAVKLHNITTDVDEDQKDHSVYIHELNNGENERVE